MKAVFLDFATLGPGLDTGSLHALLPGLDVFDVTTRVQVEERIRNAEFVITNKARLTSDLLQGCRKLRFVGLTATGTDNVDLDAARQLGIAVSNIRAYCTQSVAEHVFGCLLNLTHSLSQFDASVAAGEWQRSDDFCLLSHPVRELSNMTLGIVGHGELGKGVSRLATSFGMDVIVAARPGSNSVPPGRVAFDAFLGCADVVSLHCPLNDATRNLFDETAFEKMKRSAILINTARGGLVNSAALVDALQRRKIAAAAIDVLPTEPPINGDPLLDYRGTNLMVTPHIAWASGIARQAAIDEVAKNIAAFLQGRKRNRVD